MDLQVLPHFRQILGMGHTNRSRWGHTLELRHFHAATSRLGCLGLSDFLCNPTSLVKSIQKQRPVSHDLEVGICGEHGGDPKSIWFCHKIGLNYVSWLRRWVDGL